MLQSRENIEEGNKRLLRLASYVERRQRALKCRGRRYNQEILNYDCGAPACMKGHFLVLWPGVKQYHSQEFFALSCMEHMNLFGVEGCGNAGRNWRKAVAYVRRFVANRRELAAL